MTITVAKSGWPVTGHRQVSSGVSQRISYGLPGRGLSSTTNSLEGSLGIWRSPVSGRMHYDATVRQS